MHYTIDIETNGLPLNAGINFVGIHCIEADQYEIFHLPKQREACINRLQELQNETLVYHGGKFDTTRILYELGVDLPISHDTMILAYLTSTVPELKENRGRWLKLKYAAPRILGVANWDVSTKDKTSHEPEKVVPYLKLDLKYTSQLFLVLKDQLPKDLYKIYKLIMHSLNVYKRVELNGMPIDEGRLEELLEEQRETVEDAKHELDYFSSINWNSPKQLQQYLYEELQLPIIKYTNSGQPATDSYTLAELRDRHPVIGCLLAWRKEGKRLVFLEDWKNRVINGRLHGNFNLHTTVSGRTSCSEPNLQQVPRDKALKSLFCSTDPEWEFVQADYSQAELRFASIVAGVQAIKDAYRNGEDLHTNMAALVSGKPKSEVTKQDRNGAKAANFGYVYGMQAQSFVEHARKSYGVHLTLEEAQSLRLTFFDRNHELVPHYKSVERTLLSEGVIYSIMGRRYWTQSEVLLDPAKRAEYFRSAINFTVQSSASDYVLCGLIEVDKRLPKDEVRLIGTVHDSVLLVVKKNEHMRANLELVRDIMQKPQLAPRYLNPDYPIDIPIVVDVEIGAWGAGVSIEEYFKKERTTDE